MTKYIYTAAYEVQYEVEFHAASEAEAEELASRFKLTPKDIVGADLISSYLTEVEEEKY